MAGKGRPVRPFEIRDQVRWDPSFSQIQDAKREVMRVLKLLKRLGVVEKAGEGCYSLTLPIALPEDFYTKPNLPKYIPEKVKPVVQVWGRIFKLRALQRAYCISTLGHAIFHELVELRIILENIRTSGSRERMEIISELVDRINSLGDVYIEYARRGVMPKEEGEEFRGLEEGVERLYRTLR
jgi:hypothetical protein